MATADSENIRIVRAVFDAWERWDAEAGCAICTEDCDYTLPRSDLEGGSYVGHAGVRRGMAEAQQEWASLRFDLRETKEHGDVVMARFRGTNTAHNGPTVEFDATFVMRMRDGRLAHSRVYLDFAEAEAAFAREVTTPRSHPS